MKKNAFLLGFSVILICLFMPAPWPGQCFGGECHKTPLDMGALQETLSYARGETKSHKSWPRVIEYEDEVYDFRKDVIHHEKRTFAIEKQPLRIIPHAVGVAEILWAICPRQRLIAFNELSADPEFSFIADLVKKRFPVFKSKQTELMIGYQPDLVFAVFYSGADFKEKLKRAKILFFDLGYFGTIESIKRQTLLIGKIIGEEGNAEALVRVMDEQIHKLRQSIPAFKKATRVLYYDEGGYIPGASSNFSSICNMIGVINVGAEQGIKSWSQIDYETLLKWDPDMIIVPEGRHLKEQLMANEVLSHASAIQKHEVHDIPRVYLSVDSQYMILSANLLAGMVYEKAF